MFHYGVTCIGAYHVKNGTVCQDAHHYVRIDDRFAIGAVADGLGSEEHSDIASKIAAETATEYLAKRVTRSIRGEAILTMIREAFSEALACIARAAVAPLDQYDTTLSLAVFRDGTVYYGHSGDGGIIAGMKDGKYVPLTVQQRDEDDCVFPLCSGPDKWVFGEKSGVASVLLATDGIYGLLFPSLLKNSGQPMYVALTHYLMSEEALGFSSLGEEEAGKRMSAFVEQIPESQVNDDKTILVMLDPAVAVKKQPEAYYAKPDWKKIRKEREEAYRREAYPSLYKNEPGKETKTEPAESKRTFVFTLRQFFKGLFRSKKGDS